MGSDGDEGEFGHKGQPVSYPASLKKMNVNLSSFHPDEMYCEARLLEKTTCACKAPVSEIWGTKGFKALINGQFIGSRRLPLISRLC